ncbi:MAG: histidine--tRNA ligase [Microbacteriaceae bacterium]
MAQQVTPPRGMRDILPAEKKLREYAFSQIRRNYFAHGFDEIETPVLEEFGRLHSGLGGDNEKLSYSVLKRGISAEQLEAAASSGDANALADLGLRFDLTVPLARYYASNQAVLPKVFRSLQMGPVWRAERPQKGRYRQFVQCDIDIIGEPSVLAEIELISATLDTLNSLGVSGCRVRINDRRLLSAMLSSFGFEEQFQPSVLITIDKLDKLGVDGVLAELLENGANPDAVEKFRAFMFRPQTMEYNPFGERQIRKALPEGMPEEAIADLLATGEGLAQIVEGDGISGLPLVFDPFLVRGMGYYTGQIFEIEHQDFGYALGGGGRYDGMIGRFLNRDVPAAGFSIGFERIVEILSEDTDTAQRNVALLYEQSTDYATLFALKASLLREGARVRIVAKPKKLSTALSALAQEGFTEFVNLKADEDYSAQISGSVITQALEH